jgi:hypothetical protein
MVPLRLEAELALGEVLSRRAGDGGRVLPALAREAAARGFMRVAAEARRMLPDSSSVRVVATRPTSASSR